jgi:hypothetical protein
MKKLLLFVVFVVVIVVVVKAVWPKKPTAATQNTAATAVNVKTAVSQISYEDLHNKIAALSTATRDSRAVFTLREEIIEKVIKWQGAVVRVGMRDLQIDMDGDGKADVDVEVGARMAGTFTPGQKVVFAGKLGQWANNGTIMVHDGSVEAE